MKVKKCWSFHYRFLYRGDLCQIPYSIMYSNLMSLVRSLVWSGHTVYSNRPSREKMTSSAKRRFRTWKPSLSGRHSTLGSIFHQHGKSRKFRHMQKTYQKWPEIEFSHESLDILGGDLPCKFLDRHLNFGNQVARIRASPSHHLHWTFFGGEKHVRKQVS